MNKEEIIAKLREQGCRITKQRMIILDIILEGNCSCCKEIYYQALKVDDSIGTATVYRMINVLEDIGVINRKNMYRLECQQECEINKECKITYDDNNICFLSREQWKNVMEAGLKACGYLNDRQVCAIEIQ